MIGAKTTTSREDTETVIVSKNATPAASEMTRFTIRLLRNAFSESDPVVPSSSVISRRVRHRATETHTFCKQADAGHVYSQYETSSEDVRRLFEEHGEIKTFFDLIANRGMVFVTYVSVPVRPACHQSNEAIISTICALQREQEIDCKVLRSVAVPYVLSLVLFANMPQFLFQIDVHYSLPRDDSQGRATEKQKDQVRCHPRTLAALCLYMAVGIAR